MYVFINRKTTINIQYSKFIITDYGHKKKPHQIIDGAFFLFQFNFKH